MVPVMNYVKYARSTNWINVFFIFSSHPLLKSTQLDLVQISNDCRYKQATH